MRQQVWKAYNRQAGEPVTAGDLRAALADGQIPDDAIVRVLGALEFDQVVIRDGARCVMATFIAEVPEEKEETTDEHAERPATGDRKPRGGGGRQRPGPRAVPSP